MDLWLQLEVRAVRHPKFLKAGTDAFVLWVASLAYCKEHGLDGEFPAAAVESLTPLVQGAKARKAAGRLTDAGSWAKNGDMIEVHDYLDHQESGEKVKKRRDDTRRRVKDWRDKQGNALQGPLRNAGSNGGVTGLDVKEVELEVQKPKLQAKASPDGAKPRERCSRKLAVQLREEFGVEFEQTPTLHESYRQLLVEAKRHLPAGTFHNVSMGVISDYVEEVQGSPLTGDARSHTARLIKAFPAIPVLDAFGEALNWGAGLKPEYAADPLALTKYVTSVMHGAKR